MAKESPEHIFPATALTKLAIKWKEAVAEGGRDREAHALLEDIVIGSEPMFRRFAQYEGFDRSVDIDRLVSVAQEKVARWLLAWSPDLSLFSWLTACSKNAFRSEANKENVFRKRHHVTGDNLEKFFGQEEHGVEKAEIIQATESKITSIQSRWGSSQEIGTIRYLIECVSDGTRTKSSAQRAAAYAWGLSPELVKFFWNWVLMEMRNAFYSKIRVPFTEQDLIRHAYAYDHLIDLLNIITFDQLKKIIAVMGGTHIRIPTLAKIAKLKENYEVFQDIEDSDKDPASVEAIGKKWKKSAKSAQEVYLEMLDTLKEDRCGEYPIYEEIDDKDEEEDEDYDE